ncbi:winged helix-turn-helix transcriptional regulator [Streptomyces millisiae]|uniref:Helix-turn-helix domain-containing protein n=1 Tax=Streptomyces millisiae TaxID=3075542 RepID=A0ABU2LXP1_9ACTN|nr:helix-turn-helix domain-containing protein [Streptomyces sp. DSM 44918]MDT0322356.1 helix-turn-helix domain-containing protein [Streptomyces sp. DSM 44918]
MTHPTVGHAPGLPDDPRARVAAPAPGCPVEIALDALRGRWTTLVVRELLTGPRTYSELSAALPALSDKVLTDRLRHLTEAAVLDRERVPGFPPGVRYHLTERGRELGPVLQALWDWGARYAGDHDAEETTGAGLAVPRPARAAAAGRSRA